MHGGSSARLPTKPTEKLKIEKMYAIKQIKICAEYRDMLPRPRLDLSGTPGLRPNGLSPGSWQTSLGLGSMSRYSAQILICIAAAYTIVCTTAKLYRPTGLFFGDWNMRVHIDCYCCTLNGYFHQLNFLNSISKYLFIFMNEFCVGILWWTLWCLCAMSYTIPLLNIYILPGPKQVSQVVT